MKKKHSSYRRGVAWIAVCAGLAAGAVWGGGLAIHSVKAGQNSKGSQAEHVKGELVVKTREAQGDVSAARQKLTSILAQKLGGEDRILEVAPFVTDSSLFKVRVSDDKHLKGALEALNSDPWIQYAEPNYIYRTFEGDAPQEGAPNDPELSKLWGMINSGQADSSGQAGVAGVDVNVLPLWKQGITGSRDVLVAVIDTGVDWDHPDLAANIYTNPGEAGDKASNGIDDDGNGFIDDVHGWNFAAKSNNSKDDHNHGTHVSGTIAAVGNNAVGIVGVAWQTSILPIKFLTASGSGSLVDAVESINYARLMKAQIMSNSWGGGGFSQTMRDAIAAAKDAGILFVAAAGNENRNNDTTPAYPASYDVANVVSVAAIDNRGKLASFSNWGATKVHVAAPGVRVYSAVKGGGYAAYSGTSMATPHISGIAALLMSVDSSWSYDVVKSRLITTSEPVRTLRKKVVAKGRASANNAYYNIVPPNTDPDESLWKLHEQVIETPHPYKDNLVLDFTVNYPGAKYIRVIFDKVDVEVNYDKILVKDSNGEVWDELTGQLENYVSEYVEGDTLQIRFTSDVSNTGYGFRISKIQVITE